MPRLQPRVFFYTDRGLAKSSTITVFGIREDGDDLTAGVTVVIDSGGLALYRVT